MAHAHNVLIIDDDVQLVTMLAELLQLEGYAVAGSHRGDDGLRHIAAHDVDIVILDVMMPGLDGFDTLSRLRCTSNVPVLMLTARGEEQDRITGFEHGADDYLAKPFNPRELLLRVRAILKRQQPGESGEALSLHGLTLDPQAMSARLDGEILSLTGAEFRVLEGLVRANGSIASRESLTRFALGRKLNAYDRALDTHISNLRQKLGGDASPLLIRNVRGSGYLLLARED